MERGTKRKAATLGSPATPQHLQTPSSDRPAKRVRTPLVSESKAPPAKGVQDEARDFLEHLKRATDKNGRLVSTVFLELPHPDELPDYYDLINLPISVETIQAKIDGNEYSNLSEVESDVKRMVANAKKYNESKSEIYDDAERIRKLTFNYMTRMNPAYKSGSYTAVATPEPAEPLGYPGGASAAAAAAAKKSATKAAAPTPTPKQREPSRSISVAVAAPTVAPDDSNFVGKTLKEAQEMILRDAIAYTVDDLEIFTPFVNLPPRSLTEYYAQIKQPTSLKGTLKKVHGIHGRNEATGVTDFKTWDAFEAEVSKIWNNCREFNEDGSDMYNLAQTFEDWVHERVSEARAAIPDPAAPTLKLNLGKSGATNIKLRLGQKESPAPPPVKSASPSIQRPGISIDQQSLQRQRALVDEAVLGRPTSRHSNSQFQGTGRIASPPLPGAGLKREASGVNGVHSPAMLPPTLVNATRLPNGVSSYPLTSSSVLQQAQQAHNPYQNFTQPPTGIDSKWRADGKGKPLVSLRSLRINAYDDQQVQKTRFSLVCTSRLSPTRPPLQTPTCPMCHQHYPQPLPSHSNMHSHHIHNCLSSHLR